jgi:hypothetical protein
MIPPTGYRCQEKTPAGENPCQIDQTVTAVTVSSINVTVAAPVALDTIHCRHTGVPPLTRS